MDEIYKLANQYYQDLESFSSYGGVRSVAFWFFLFCFAMFIYFLILTYHSHADYITIWRSPWAPLTYILELFSLIFLYLYKKERDELYVVNKLGDNVNASSGDDKKNLSDKTREAKVKVLCELLDIQQNQFISKIEYITKMIDNDKKYNNQNYLSNKIILSFLFSSESKPRIIALFIYTCSLLAILFARTDVRIVDYLFDTLSNNSILHLVIIYFSILIILVSIILCIYILAYLFKRVFVYIYLFFSGDNIQHPEIVRYLLCDLNKYSVFDKSANS